MPVSLVNDGTLSERTDEAWLSAIAEALGELQGVDGENIYRAIDLASAGGLGHVDVLDVHDTIGAVDIVEAMRLAQGRDRISRQYATGFTDLFQHVLPVVSHSLDDCHDLLGGICQAHLRLLREEPDSLIARKNGSEVALAVQQRAGEVDLQSPQSIAQFDQWLRRDGHKLNPGTTADLIAASLYLMLRTPTQ